MSKSNGTAKTFGRILSYILAVLIVLGLLGGAAYLIARRAGVSYYVSYGDEYYVSNINGGYLHMYGATHDFAVKSLTGGEVNYSVEITANPENDFDFTVNGDNYRFISSEESMNDYTDMFDIQKRADGFTLTFPEDLTIEQVLSAKYGGEVILSEPLEYGASYFVMTVSSDGSVVNIWFSFDDFTITLDPDRVIF